jgi:hypothetical protein
VTVDQGVGELGDRTFGAPRSPDAAELMAFDLVVKREDELIGSAVTVSNAEGSKLFSIPVQASYLAASNPMRFI